MTALTDKEVRDRLRAHQDGGVISSLFETGEIPDGAALEAAISQRMDELEDTGKANEADGLDAVLEYVVAAGERPAVSNWVNRG